MNTQRLRRRAAKRLARPALTVLRHERLKRIVGRQAVAAIRRSHPVLEVVADERLAALARAGDEGQLVLGLPPARLVDPRAVLNLADDVTVVGAVALAASDARGQPGELSAALYEAIVLGQASSSQRVQAALIAVRRRPELLTKQHAEAIAKRAVSLARQPVDPYAPHPLRITAAATISALIAAREDLDLLFAKQLAEPALRFVAAGAVQGRRTEPEKLLAQILEHISVSESQVRRFARSCDRNFSVADAVVVGTSDLAVLGRVRLGLTRITDQLVWLPRIAGVALVCAGSAGIGLLVDSLVLDLPATLRASGGAALGALALLVAVHLVSAELAADRLAGPIARATSVSLSLTACYVMAAVALVLGQISPAALDAATRSAITYGLAAGFAVSFGIALVQLLARTDSTSAATAFARRRKTRFRAAGRRLGRLHADALRGREVFALQAWVKQTMSVPIAERRVRITARRDGWLVISQRRMRRMANDDWWKRSAGRLWLSAPLGTRVDRGQELAALTGGDDDAVPSRRVRQVRKMLVQRSATGAEQAAEAVGVLIDLAARQGVSGNEAGGFRVVDAAVRLIEAHLDALLTARGNLEEGQAGAPIPVLRTAALAVGQALARSTHPSEREVLQRFVQLLLPACGPDDPFCPTLLTQLTEIGRVRPAVADQLLWDLGVRVVEAAVDVLTFSWISALDGLIEGRDDDASSLVQAAGNVAGLACYSDTTSAHQLQRALAKHLDVTRSIDILVLLRLGGAATRAGAMSIATEVAIRCRPLDLARWEAWTATNEGAAHEAVRNELFGLTLGPDPQKVLQRFISFAGQIKAIV